MALQITDQNFEAMRTSGKPLVVDFWATWCGPCQMIAPLIDELSAEYADRVQIGKCDVDANANLPGQFGVRNIPTILFFNKEGELASKLVGAQSKAALQAAIEALL